MFKNILFFLLSLLGGYLAFPLFLNGMIILNALPVYEYERDAHLFFSAIANRYYFIWICAGLTAFAFFFIRNKTRHLFLFAPVYMPLIFALLYRLSAA